MLALFLALAASAQVHPRPESRSGILRGGCRSLDAVKLCFANGNTSLLVGGKKTRLLNDGWPDFLPYQITHKNGSYSVKIGLRSLSDVPFYRYSEVTFRRSGSRYVASKYVAVSENRCDGWPDLKVTYTIDFYRSAIVTVLDPDWTRDGKGRRYVHAVKLRTSDIHKLSDEYFYDLIGRPSGHDLCKDYQGGR